jgi:hypothetical protein
LEFSPSSRSNDLASPLWIASTAAEARGSSRGISMWLSLAKVENIAPVSFNEIIVDQYALRPGFDRYARIPLELIEF